MIRLFKEYVPAGQVTAFTSHLAEFIASGVPLLRALELLQKETTHPYFQTLLRDLAGRVRAGEAFSAALRRYPRIFPPYYQSLIQAGEAGGKLDAILARLAAALEKEIELQHKVAQALAYPLLVLAFGILTIFFLMTFMVPKISVIYSEFGGEFPLVTAIVLGASRWFFHLGWILVLGIAGSAVYFLLRGNLTAAQTLWDRVSFSIPWIRKLLVQAEAARFARTLGSLLESGVTLLDALALARQTIVHTEIRSRLEGIERPIGQGKSLSETLRARRLFPETALNLIWVGESTGKLDHSLLKLGEISEKEVDRQMRLLTTLLEPIIIIVVGVVVAFIVVALLLPIFQMSLLVR